MEATGQRTRGYTNIMKLLFSIGLEFQRDLDDGHLSEDLCRKFEVGHGIVLSQDIVISLEKECSEWLITDAGNNQTYAVRKGEDKLNIYNTKDMDRNTFCNFSQLQNDQISLAEGALLIAKDAYPNLDISVYLQKLDQMAAALQVRIGQESDTTEQINHLNDYLFKEHGFAGNIDDYYNPRNSYLNEVLDRKVGIPITLAIVYIEIGRRIGLPMVGINFPGHFIVKHKGVHLETFIDPFRSGLILSDNDLSEMLSRASDEPVPIQPEFLQEATNKEILARVLRNLKQIYFSQEAYEIAIRTGEKIVSLEPQSAQDYRDLGYLYYQVNAYAESLSAFKAYLRLSDIPPDQEKITRNMRVLIHQLAMLN